jgi:hypothetical protein
MWRWIKFIQSIWHILDRKHFSWCRIEQGFYVVFCASLHNSWQVNTRGQSLSHLSVSTNSCSWITWDSWIMESFCLSIITPWHKAVLQWQHCILQNVLMLETMYVHSVHWGIPGHLLEIQLQQWVACQLITLPHIWILKCKTFYLTCN